MRAIARGLAALAVALAVACGPSSPKPSKPPPTDTTTKQPPVFTGSGVPIPGAPIATAQIDPAGGALRSADGNVTVEFPPGAVARSTQYSIQAVTSLALGAVGHAYRVQPGGHTLSAPVTLTFRGPAAYAAGTSIDGLGIVYQDENGWWHAVEKVTRDPISNTLSVASDHFSDWGVTWQAGVPGMYGPFTVTQNLDVSFSVKGTATLFYQGDNAVKTLYILTGADATLQPSITSGAATCSTVTAASTPLTPSIAEIMKSPSQFRWSVNDYWDITCSGAPQFISTTFDTLGVNLVGCARSYVGTPLIGTDHLKGTYLIDCGTKGSVTATWDFIQCVPGVACQPANPCKTGAIACDTGIPVCAENGNIANGTSCGTNMVCNTGACVACTAGKTCTTQPDTLCHDGVTECSTGLELCVNGAPKANGTMCGTDQVCNAGACIFCAANQSCTGQPDPLCHSGATSCSTGTSVCVNGAALTNGTACGTNQVCNAGVCVACTAGVACTTNPDPRCHDGATDCSTGSSACIDAAPKANGTVCGPDQVCNAGACVACTAGLGCTGQPDPFCHVGVTSCATGTSVCVNGNTLSNGTTCGTNQVCNAGACVSCTAGLGCSTQPDQLCHVGVTECSTGSSACINGAPVANGTICGSNQVCNAGACVTCTAGLTCAGNPDPLCHAGTSSCATGTSVCVDGLALANGTSCGPNQVCNGGACVSCTAGLGCATQPDQLCHVGVTDCSTGSSACIDGTPVANGTTCGSNQVCNAGACVSCTTGVACTTNPDPLCHNGATDCSTGTSVCVNTTPKANGTTCGTNQVCNGGACVSCTVGLNCATNPDPACHDGATSCSTGTSVCLDGAAKANGTTCGTNQVCNGGACVACTADADCTPANSCTVWRTRCDSGTSVCTDTGAPVANGTTCGADQVCNAGVCAPCAAGVDCTPAGSCATVWRTSCSTGTSVCTATAVPVANGATCGTGRVCSSGSCVSCTPGAECVPANPCDTGTYSCTTGPACVDTGRMLANGTTCGVNQVCASGVCGPCTEGASCVTVATCRTATITCASGSAACVDSGNLPDGTPCGTDGICSAGACVLCAAGSCVPANPCDTGTLTCGPGPICTDTGTPLADGTSCGAGSVCSAGACVACVDCTAPVGSCTVWRTSCAAGAPACLDTGVPVPDGTACGTGLVCSTGLCGACTPGASCVPSNPCDVGTLSCTPSPACTDTFTPVANGTACGANHVCGGGTCNACLPGAPCTPTPPPTACQTSSVACASGFPVCTTTNLPDLAPCGSGLVCTAGVCGP